MHKNTLQILHNIIELSGQ